MSEPVVREIFRRSPVSGNFGVEIEVEGEDLPSRVDGWVVTGDGSLRGEAYEYVLESPKDLYQLGGALNNFLEKFSEYGATIYDSVRAGVHVHINCQELTMKQLFTYIVTYLTIEDVMVNYCGEGRQGNLFCLRNKDAESLAYHISSLAINRGIRGWSDDNVRYSSCNITSVPKFGSLEFRALRTPILEDFNRINDWALALYNIKTASLEFDNPREVVDRLNKVGPVAFLQECLGDMYQNIVSATPDAIMALVGTLRNTKDVAYATNWDTMSYTRFTNTEEGVEGREDEDFFSPEYEGEPSRTMPRPVSLNRSSDEWDSPVTPPPNYADPGPIVARPITMTEIMQGRANVRTDSDMQEAAERLRRAIYQPSFEPSWHNETTGE